MALVTFRQPATVFAHVDSYVSVLNASASGISFANPAPCSSYGYHMISLESEDVVEARFLCLASGTDLKVPATLTCVELDD